MHITVPFGKMGLVKSLSMSSLCKTVVLLVAVCEVALSQAEQCSEGGSSCVLPQPLRDQTGEQDLDALSLKIRCYLGCVDQYGGSLNVMDQNTQWPTVDFSKLESKCNAHQKVHGCIKGCLHRHTAKTVTINNCRDNCYAACSGCGDSESCTGTGMTYLQTCPGSCRKTYCRFGCEVYDSIHGPTSSTQQRHPTQSTEAPSVYTASTPPPGVLRDWLFSIDSRSNLSSSQTQTSSGSAIYSTVAYIVKVSTEDEDYYYWQKYPTELFDLSSLACKTVSVSFSVISKYSLQGSEELSFSPTLSLCVPGVGGHPSQLNVNSIRVSYTEDSREEFLGYSVARVTWDRPNNFQFLTSYTIRVYPEEERCGGTTNVLYKFQNIDANLTEFTFSAKSDNGLWRFGCSYIIEVVALPTVNPIGHTIGANVVSVTELTGDFPAFELNCARVWDQEGKFSVSVTWVFPNDTQLSHISRFVLAPRLAFKGNGSLIQLFEDSSISLSNDNQKKFSVMTQKFLPQLKNSRNKLYTVEVKSERGNLYTWRKIPRTQSCSVSSSALPPRNISSVSVNNLDFDRQNQTLQLSVDVTPSMRIHGTVELYEVTLRRSLTDCYNCEGTLRYTSVSTPVEIQSTVQLNDTEHCLYLNVRLFNNYNLSSNWSPVEVLALDEWCDTSATDAVPEGPRVSVYYEDDDGEREQVLEFGCEASSFYSGPNSLATRLQQINVRLEDINSKLLATPDAEARATLLNQKLQSLDEKLDSVLELLAQSHPGT